MSVEPLPPTPGQEPIGSWANITAIMRYDPLFGAVLGLLALNALLQAVMQAWFSAVIAAAMLWGIVTFRSWGYWIVMVGAGLGVVGGVAMLAFAEGGRHWRALAPVAINAFVLIVLYTRRDRFA